MILEMIDEIFEVDGIIYHHPFNVDGRPASVVVRPMFQFRSDAIAEKMIVENNKPKKGLMDSEIDEEFVKEYLFYD